jgi:hypothetical protein
MKIVRMFTGAVLVAASFGVSDAASAQNYGGDRYNVQDQRSAYHDRRDEGDRGARRDNGRNERSHDSHGDRGYQNRDNGYDRRSYGNYDRGNGWDRRDRRCHTEWHHRHPVTRCW